jgi:FkbM family methyltransferase
MRKQAKSVLELGRSLGFAVSRGLQAKLSGQATISATCQIPQLREKYSALGLAPDKGVFVEVGAFDGETWSNTSFLADQGWRGVYVEPIPAYHARARVRHLFNRVVAENVGIADTAGTAEISVMGPLSTMNAPTAELYNTISWAQGASRAATSQSIRTERLETVFQRNAIPHHFDLMVIDVEGGEQAIVATLLQSAWRPRVMIVELIDRHSDFEGDASLQTSHREVRASLLESGYREFYADSINTIFALEA